MTARRQTGDNPRLGILYRILTVLAFAMMATFAKLASNTGIPLPELIFFRSLFALIPVLLFVAATSDFGILKTRRPKVHLLRSTIGGVGMIFVFLGITHLPLNEATAISFSVPFVATVLSALVLKEHVGPHRWFAIFLGFIGVLVLLHPDPGAMVKTGAIFALIGVCFTAMVNITIRQISATEPAVTITFYFMALSAVAMALTLPFCWITPTREQFLFLLGMGVMGGIAQLTMSISLRHASVATLVPFDYSQIIWTVIFSWLLWDELPGFDTVSGAAIVIASGLYIVYRERKVAAPPQPVASAVEES